MTTDARSRASPSVDVSVACARDSFPESVEVHRTQRAVVQSVAWLTGLAPDHATVVRAYRPIEPAFMEHLQHGAHVDVALLRRVRGLLKRAHAGAPDVAAVREMNPALRRQTTGDRGKIVVGARRE